MTQDEAKYIQRILDLEAALKDIKSNAAAIYNAEIGRDSGIANLAGRICDSIGKVGAQ